MKAALLTKEKTIKIIHMDYPKCKDNEIIIKIFFSGICGSDLSTYKGEHPYKKPPTILGHEASGIIDYIGKSVKNFKVGDKVCIQSFSACQKCNYCKDGIYNLCNNKKILNYKDLNGSFAEYLIGNEGLFFKIPDTVSFKEGALVEPLSIALHAINIINGVRNKDIAILGSGTNGISCLICSKNLGVNSVLCSDIDDSKGRRAKSFGCDYFINVSHDNLLQKTKDYFPKGVDIVFISTSYPNVLQDAVSILKKRGAISVISYLGPDIYLDYNEIVKNELTIKGSALSNPKDIELIIKWISEKQINPIPMITDQFNLIDSDKALKLMDERNASVGKIIINCVKEN